METFRYSGEVRLIAKSQRPNAGHLICKLGKVEYFKSTHSGFFIITHNSWKHIYPLRNICGLKCSMGKGGRKEEGLTLKTGYFLEVIVHDTQMSFIGF